MSDVPVPEEWCLFLDRDGVINERIPNDYVRSWSDFEFLPGAIDGLVRLATIAPRIVVVTNQQGVAKGLMSAATVAHIHAEMIAAIKAEGGRVDAVLTCPHLASAGCACRKPQPGLAANWLAAHPTVRPEQSVMAGDSPTDLEMARRLSRITGGCRYVGIGGGAGAGIAYGFGSLLGMALDPSWVLEEAR